MRHIFTLLFGIFVGINCNAQTITPELLGFEEFKLQEEQLGEIYYYLSSDTTNIKKPLLLYLDGSGAFPLFQKIKNGIGSTVVIDFQKLRNDYRILLISKPSIPFVDTVNSNENGFPVYKAPKEYTERLSLNWRVKSANSIIDALINKNIIDTTKIVVLGFSEGAQVAPKLATKNKNITHLLLFGGNGLNQLFDPIITARMKATRGQIFKFDNFQVKS